MFAALVPSLAPPPPRAQRASAAANGRAIAYAAALRPESAEFPEGAAVLRSWFDHIERDELDSLAAMLAPDFVFVSDGARYDARAFVAMIKGLRIEHPKVRLARIVGRRDGTVGCLAYDRTETFLSRGVRRQVPETGTMVLRKVDGAWLIAFWTTTSPPGGGQSSALPATASRPAWAGAIQWFGSRWKDDGAGRAGDTFR